MSPQAEPVAGRDRASTPESADRIVREILIHGPLSRVEIARRLGLSGPSLTRLTKPLIASGRLFERASRAQTVGRPLQPLDLDPGAEHFAGVKVTADAIYAVVTDLRGSIRAESKASLTTHDPVRVGRAIALQVKAIAGAFTPLSGVGIGLGGRTADGRTVGESRFLKWNDVPLAEMVETETGLPVVVANDVNALTQAQHWFGAGRDLETFAVVTIGAGIGMGLVAHGELLTGLHGGEGSIGHQLLACTDAVCWLGHNGCASALLSTGAVESAATRVGRSLGYQEILRGAERGDPDLRGVVDAAGEALGLLLAGIVNVFDPQKILLAGEGARLGEVGEHAMASAFGRATVWDSSTPIEVQPFAFTEWARGAATTAIRARMLRPA